MPNIKTYENQIEAPRPTNTGAEAYELEGRHIEGNYAQAGEAIGRGIGEAGAAVQTHYEIQDSSAVSAQGAQAFADLSKSLSSTMSNADPNKADETADGWRSQMEDAISKVGGNAVTEQGQQMAQRVQNTLREEFTRQSMAYQSTLSGTAIINNLEQTKDGLAAAVKLNPGSLPAAISYLHGAMQDQIKAHSFLSQDEVGRVQDEFTAKATRDLGLSAFETMAQNNPAAAKAALTSDTFAGIFSGEDINTLSRYADAQGKAAVEAKTAQDNLTNKQNTEAFKANTSQLIGSMIRPDGSLQVPPGAPQKIIAASLMPGADPGEIRSMIDMTKTINKDAAAGVKAKTDPATYAMFNTKMLAGQLTDADVYSARAAGQLSDHDTSYFISAQKNLATDPAKKAAMKDFANFSIGQKPAFVHGSGQISVDPATGNISMGSSDPVGAQNYANFYRAAQQQYDAAYAKDPDAAAKMLDPKSPSYLGRLAPQYLSNKKSADFAGPTTSAPLHLAGNKIDSYVSDPANKGKSFIAPDGKTYRIP